MRAHYKERYDFRRNAVDWDYTFYLIKFAKTVHKYEYYQWRLQGNAFDIRLAAQKTPNRTFSSYVEGKKKRTRDSILVRGYWGDIVNSPYIPLGIEIDTIERKKFFREVNYQRVYHASDLAEYNVMSWIYKLQTLKKYEYKFQRLAQLGVDQPKTKEEELKEGCTVEEVKEDAEGEDKAEEEESKAQEEEVKEEAQDEEQKEEENQEPQPLEEKKEEEEEPVDALLKSGNKINLAHEIEDNNEVTDTQQLLQALKKYKIKFHLISDPIQKLAEKKRYKSKFDLAVISSRSAAFTQDLNQVFKKGAFLHVETIDTFVGFKKENQEKYREVVTQKAKDFGWTP